jgi:hypothetical protein
MRVVPWVANPSGGSPQEACALVGADRGVGQAGGYQGAECT